MEGYYLAIITGMYVNIITSFVYILFMVIRMFLVASKSANNMMRMQGIQNKLNGKRGNSSLGFFTFLLPFAKTLEVMLAIKEEGDYYNQYGGDIIDFAAYKIDKDFI